MEKLLELAETTSTNDEIKRAIDAGEAEGLSVLALKQTAGYGRQGRTWESPIGGLYQSFLMRPSVPSTQLSTLSLVMGMAVCNAVRAVLPEARQGQVMVKWPNDVVLVEGRQTSASLGASAQGNYFGQNLFGQGDFGFGASPASQAPAHQAFKKIAGISLERYKDAVCVGIGINVAQPDSAEGVAVPEDTKNKAVYLDDLGLWAGSAESRVKQVSKVLTQKVWALYGQWQRIGFGDFSQSFNAHYNALAGQQVSMVDINDRPLAQGRVEYVDGRGELVLLDAQGYECSVASGEAHIV